ncbi:MULTISPECIES: Rieske (2Fe-2S) protein [unclassified Paenibacillus]|uniref:Rieske (2Fe-2S) protein n=1 Tax=unclassified Paenibacillus TaxID=185978 RepID=UPI001AE1CB8D|nr:MULTISPECIES: Rieske (2Fe-2S) protein [unclassified Paenibacillus]MBP1157020.1 nitrite reductase/ring-hydroxylating ferredoxin subunit [Paenibacillus sp. PvP091]MBP1172241.1 nitrite reductase/ring-hydroxylating ferredoxin subunit [Paenibacillus sp. PvR098]MBP2438622.1 nitrite reductase/ring-hydroxylating ferredoxin subunit [Paenibacillus sp. PvP052]
MKHLVCKYDDLKSEGKKAVSIDRKAIVVVRSTSGEVYALRDVCPHKGPCLSAGMLDVSCTGDTVGEYIFEKDKEVLRCPWHSWEFDIKTGRSLFDPDKVKVKTYEVTIENDMVFVEV